MTSGVNLPRKRGLWQRMSEYDARHPLLWNLFPIALYVVTLGLAALAADSLPTKYPALQLALSVFIIGPLAWRRRYPWAVFLIQQIPMPVVIATNLTGNESGIIDSASVLGFSVAIYNLVLHRPLKLLWWAVGISTLGSVVQWWVNSQHSVWQLLSEVFSTLTFVGFVAAIALMVRTRRDYQTTEREQHAREAVSAERTRIAREMHDIIGHNLAVINALADGGAYAAKSSPDQAKTALEAIGKTSREALGELRRVLSVLQSEDGEEAELAPQPGLGELPPLIERVREAGLPVVQRVSGERWELSENQQLAVYRTVQEALTNVFKHASGNRRAEVSLDYRDDGLSVVVANSGSLVEGSGAHRGLAGLTERAQAFGGTMTAGPQSVGGWRVALWLPRNGKYSSHARPDKERTS